MLVYHASTNQFMSDIQHNRLTDIMSGNFKNHWGRAPNFREVNSWRESLPTVKSIIELADLTDNMVALEYEVPYNQNRIDCLLFGKGEDLCENIVLIELKAWSEIKVLEEEGNYVETYTGGGYRVVAHPSQQAGGYHNYLKGLVSEFGNHPPLTLFSCAYCHNYGKKKEDGLFSPVYQKIIDDFPLYAKEDAQVLADKIKFLLSKGAGFEIFNRFMRSPIRPSMKLLDNVAQVVKNEVVFSLLEEQLVAKNLIWSKIRSAEKKKEKSVIIVHGGPGTGKSVIAVNLLAEAARKGKKVFYGCKSKPFIEGLKKLVGKDGSMLFSNLYRFLPSKVAEDELDLLLVDEAHRIEKTSNHQYTKPEERTDMPQIEQLVRCAKTAVFFIDDKQNVRSQEVGSSDLIRQAVAKFKCSLNEVELLTQYRCMGSNDYLLWLESTLGYSGEERTLRKNEIFDFKIFDDPQKLYDELRKKEIEKPNSARMVAGFCWPWSKTLDENGDFVKDVRIGDFAMPWESHGDITKLPHGYVKWYEWAYKPEGFKQVGCIYTAQGFEFDYVGVIIGADLVYDADSHSLKADMSQTKDPTLKKSKQNFESHVKNIYRTLLSRGMRGCYVYFVDKEVEKFVRSRIEDSKAVASVIQEVQSRLAPIIEFHIPERERFKEYLPVYSLQAAAGYFGHGEAVTESGWVKADIGKKLDRLMFVAKVVGHSMEPTIPNGSWCVFRANPGGSRQGKIVLVQHHSIDDPDTGGKYTIKKYHSKKKFDEQGGWEHEEIVLQPLNPGYKPINISTSGDTEFIVVAEFVTVL